MCSREFSYLERGQPPSSPSVSLYFVFFPKCPTTTALLPPPRYYSLRPPEIFDSYRKPTVGRSLTFGVKMTLFLDLRRLLDLREPSPNKGSRRSISSRSTVNLKSQYSEIRLLGRFWWAETGCLYTLLIRCNGIRRFKHF